MGGIETKKNYSIVLVILLVTYIGFANVAVGYKPTITPNTNYRSTYTPTPNYNSFIPPTQLSGSNYQQSVQLSTSGNIEANLSNATAAFPTKLIREEFRIVGDSNEPIPNAQVAGLDGSSNSFLESADNNGFVVIDGAPGVWQFTVYASGYFNKLVNSKFEDNTDVMFIELQKIIPEKINPTGNRYSGNNTEANESETNTIPDWLCGSNGNSESDSDIIPDQSSDTGAMG